MVGQALPGIFRVACALLGVEPGEAMMVGDDLESDLPPARSLGMRTCLVRTGKGATFRRAGPMSISTCPTWRRCRTLSTADAVPAEPMRTCSPCISPAPTRRLRRLRHCIARVQG